MNNNFYQATKLENERIEQVNTTTKTVRYFDPAPNNCKYNSNQTKKQTSAAMSTSTDITLWRSYDNKSQQFIVASNDICQIFSNLAIGDTVCCMHIIINIHYFSFNCVIN